MTSSTSILFGLGLTAALLAGSDLTATERPEAARFHHVRLNVTNPEATTTFYEKFFGATEVLYRNRSQALFTERSFLLLDAVDSPPASNEGTSLWHIGWSGVDGASEFEWRVAEGIEVETPLTRPILPGADNKVDVMNFFGPDREIVEVATANRNHRFEHIHLLATDADATTAWFRDQLGLAAQYERAIDFHGVMLNVVKVDNVDIVIFARPTPDRDNQFAAKALWPAGGFRPTEGSVLNNLAFSYAEIEPVLARMTAAGVPIVRKLRTDPTQGHTSFFVRGPDNLLIEIVADKPIPDGNWSEEPDG